MDRLDAWGVTGLTTEEQEDTNGGGDWVPRTFGRVLGFLAGLMTRYENPRYTGDWMG